MSKVTLSSYMKARVSAAKRIARINDRLELMRKQLAVDCKHPSSAVYEFDWEHDNGYGRQTMMKGERCLICRAEKRWKSSTLWTTEEERKRWRSDYE